MKKKTHKKAARKVKLKAARKLMRTSVGRMAGKSQRYHSTHAEANKKIEVRDSIKPPGK